MTAELISIVLPVYDEDQNITTCLQGLWEALRGHQHEILICYDFDEDTTLAAIAEMADKPSTVRLVRNNLGPGVARAMRAGFEAARGDVIVTSMADLSDPPHVIVEMAERIRRSADVVSGSRFMKGGSLNGGPLIKRVLSRMAGLSLYWLAGLKTHDATTNFRAYSRRLLESLSIESQTGFEIALELTVKAHLNGFNVTEVPSTCSDRKAGKSRFLLVKWLPKYLRWYLAALTWPLAVWGLLVGLAVLLVRRVVSTQSGEVIHYVGAAILVLASSIAVLLARRWRGKTSWPDSMLPLAWLHPGQANLLSNRYAVPAVLVVVAVSAILLYFIRVKKKRLRKS